jgi:hypothetical protein
VARAIQRREARLAIDKRFAPRWVVAVTPRPATQQRSPRRHLTRLSRSGFMLTMRRAGEAGAPVMCPGSGLRAVNCGACADGEPHWPRIGSAPALDPDFLPHEQLTLRKKCSSFPRRLGSAHPTRPDVLHIGTALSANSARASTDAKRR